MCAQDEWLSQRQEDPGISDAGHEQLTSFVRLMKKLKKKAGCGRYKVVTSPMMRALQTSVAVASALRAADLLQEDADSVEVSAEWKEVGGIYSAQASAHGSFVKMPGKARSPRAIKDQFGFNVDALPSNGPWDGGRGFETLPESLARAERVAR